MMGDEEEQLSEKKKANLSDSQIIKLDAEIRESKVGKCYEPKPSDDIVRCMNQLNDNLGLILVEMRRMCDILSYQMPTQKEE